MVLMLKRAHSRSNLRVRTLAAMAKVRPSRPRSLTLRLLTAPARALLKRAHQPRNLHIRTLGTMVKAQPSHPRPLMLRFLIGLARALIFYF
mgnify:FL=1